MKTGRRGQGSTGAALLALLWTIPAVWGLYEDQYDNCQTIVPGKLNMHYKVTGGELEMALEGQVSGGDSYLSVGFAPPGYPFSIMLGGTAVIVGTVGDECFAKNFDLASYDPCDYAAGKGACPLSVTAEDLYPVEMVGCEKVGKGLGVQVKRALGKPGTLDAWPVDGSQWGLYAIGKVSSSSTVEDPVALEHSIETPNGDAYSLMLDGSTNDCTPIIVLKENNSTAPEVVTTPPTAPEVVTTPPTAPENDVSESGDDDGKGEGGDDAGESGGNGNNDAVGNLPAPAPGVEQTSCFMTIDGKQEFFDECTSIKNIGPGFSIAYNISAVSGQPGKTLLNHGYECHGR